MSLRQFMLRKEVKLLYKDLIKACKEIGDRTTSQEMIEWVRHDFKKNMRVEDEAAIRMLVVQGRQSLKQLQTSISISK
ncbi:hypothetical protein EB796_003770 [Bugula neritina]|uniref:LYR motif-containing protein 2 n=1 Tax=Bugula neritina TaxID=10212 RepID=A0A7J7KJ20_BUGNE|nr:hypothetical protein EB796_003770 [Bugula neritina]